MCQRRCVSLCTAVFAWAWAAVSLAGVSGQEISQGFVRIAESGRLECVQRVSKQVCEARQGTRTVKKQETRTVQYDVVENGQKETREKAVIVEVEVPETFTYTVCKTVYEQVLISFAPGTNGFIRETDKTEIPVYDVTGNRLSVNSLEERLKDWTLVVFSKTGKPLDKKLAAVFRAGTIVVAVPPSVAPIAMPPMVVPAPVQVLPAPTTSVAPNPATASPVAFFAAEAVPPVYPASAEPGFAYVKVWGEKQLALRTETETSIVTDCTIARKVSMLVDGKPVSKEVPELKKVERLVLTQETVKFDLADVEVTRTPNREYTRSDLPSVLANEVLAVVSKDGKEINPLWLRNLREGVFVVVCPQMPESCGPIAAAPVMAAPAPIPMPATPAPAPRVESPAPQPAPAPRPFPAPAPGT